MEIRCNPVAWAGAAPRIVRTLKDIAQMDKVDLIVPGHGPVVNTTALDVLSGYWAFVDEVARSCFNDGVDATQCARDALPTLPYPFSDWEHPERLYINIDVQLRILRRPSDSNAEVLTHEQKSALILEQGALLAEKRLLP